MIRRVLQSPDFRRSPVRGLLKRVAWRLRWRVSSTPWVVDSIDGFRIAVPRSLVGKLIFYQGPSEPETRELLLRLFRPGMVVLDVGANVGEYTLLAARSVGLNGKVHAFEPNASLCP